VWKKQKKNNANSLSFSLTKCQSHPLAERQTIHSFLILPVQRIPRYALLLNELIKSTKEDHPDYEFIKQAHTKMKEVGLDIDMAIKDAERRAMCLELQSLFILSDVKFDPEPYRMFLLKGEVEKQCKRARKPRILFLFNDVLLSAHRPNTPAENKFRITWKMTLEEGSVEDQPNHLNAFVLKAPGKSFCVYAPTVEDKNTWISTLNTAIEKAKERVQSRNIHTVSNQAAVWTPDQFLNKCTICERDFTFIRRRHHCRKCGSLVCSDCSNQFMIVKEVNPDQLVRVCNNCKESK